MYFFLFLCSFWGDITLFLRIVHATLCWYFDDVFFGIKTIIALRLSICRRSAIDFSLFAFEKKYSYCGIIEKNKEWSGRLMEKCRRFFSFFLHFLLPLIRLTYITYLFAFLRYSIEDFMSRAFFFVRLWFGWIHALLWQWRIDVRQEGSIPLHTLTNGECGA